jgi:hypothetical protein
LGEVFFGLRPEQASADGGIFFNSGREGDEFSDILAQAAFIRRGELELLEEEGGIETEIHLDVADLGLGMFELGAMGHELYRAGALDPSLLLFHGDPQVPIGVEDVGVIGVEDILSDDAGLLGRDTGIEALLEDRGLTPGDGVQGKIMNARALFRKQKLAHDGEGARDDLDGLEMREPEAEIKRVGHELS